MSLSSEPANEREEFERSIAANPEMLVAARFILENAPSALNSVGYLRKVLTDQDFVVKLLRDLQEQIAPEDLAPSTTTNSTQCDVWSFFGVLLMLQGKGFQALEVFDALYVRILQHQSTTGRRFHKGLPLFQMSTCYQNLGLAVLLCLIPEPQCGCRT